MSVHPLKTILTNQPWKPCSTTIEAPARQLSGFKPKPLSSTTHLVTTQHIEWLWIQLTSIYGQLFIMKHGMKDRGAWVDTLKDLTPIALESGLDRLKKLSAGDKFTEYPPNCLQFKSLCLAFYEDLRLPKASDAYLEIRNKAYCNNIYWTHAVVKFIAQKLTIDFFDIQQEAEAYKQFKLVYNDVCHLVRQGMQLPKVEHRVMVARTSNKAVAKQHLNHIKQRLGA